MTAQLVLHSVPPITLSLYLTMCISVNTFPRPFDMLDIIEARHSRSIWECISHTIPNAIDIPFHVIDAVESSSQVVLIVVDKIMHKS